MIYRGIGLRWRPGVRNETARLVSSATWTSGRTRRGGFRPLRDVARILDRFDRRYVINSSRAARGARAAAPARPQIPAAAVTARPHTWPGSACPCHRRVRINWFAYTSHLRSFPRRLAERLQKIIYPRHPVSSTRTRDPPSAAIGRFALLPVRERYAPDGSDPPQESARAFRYPTRFCPTPFSVLAHIHASLRLLDRHSRGLKLGMAQGFTFFHVRSTAPSSANSCRAG